VPATLEGSIQAYARRVGTIAHSDESAELSALFAEREGIRDDLLAGAALDEGCRRMLSDADARLLGQSRILARNFPGFDADAVIHDVIGDANSRPRAG
jgi:hypothetical protein